MRRLVEQLLGKGTAIELFTWHSKLQLCVQAHSKNYVGDAVHDSLSILLIRQCELQNWSLVSTGVSKIEYLVTYMRSQFGGTTDWRFANTVFEHHEVVLYCLGSNYHL